MVGVAGFLGKDTKSAVKPLIDKLYALTDENGAEFDAEADAFLTALSQKDYPALADFCERWNITEDSLPGYLIARIAEPIRLNPDDEKRFGIRDASYWENENQRLHSGKL